MAFSVTQAPSLTVVFVVSAPHPRIFSSAELPHVHFSPYTRDESIEILSKTPLPIKKIKSDGNDEDGDSSEEEEPTEDDLKEELYVWQKFCATIWDSIAKGAARDVVRFRAAVEKNWATFVQPIARGEYGTRNYSSLYLYHKSMFQREEAVMDSVIPPAVNERATAVVKSMFTGLCCFEDCADCWQTTTYPFIPSICYAQHIWPRIIRSPRMPRSLSRAATARSGDVAAV